EVQEVEINAPSIGYQTRSAARQQVANPQSNEGYDSSVDKSSSSSDNLDSNEGSNNEASSSLVEDTELIRGDIIKEKRQSLEIVCAGNITEKVRMIDSKLPEYPNIEAKYKFYVLGWMSEAPGNYYPTMVREFYANYIAFLEGFYKKGQKPLEM
ncbi:hypothetical protein HAX54_018133, partial [Datura stramonium]|nr:hypothetical protein [Datura stramonium]